MYKVKDIYSYVNGVFVAKAEIQKDTETKKKERIKANLAMAEISRKAVANLKAGKVVKVGKV